MSNGAAFDAGTYDLSETGLAGYTASAWVCTGGSTRTHGTDHPRRWARRPPARSPTTTTRRSLTLIKVVVNDNGGTAVASDLDADRDRTRPRSLGRGPSRVVNGAGFDAGTYDLSETGPDRLHGQRLGLHRWRTGRQATRSPSAWVTTVTCTITNDDNAPRA